MPNGFVNLALGLAVQVGSPGPSEAPNAPVPYRAFGQYGFEGSSEQRYAYDSQMNWVHGYHQEISAYGGHPVYRPYNYKDVLSQSQTAAGWGERPAMPYSQQYWHKYHDQATMLKLSRHQVVPSPYYVNVNQVPPMQGVTWVAQPNGLQVPVQQVPVQQGPWQAVVPPTAQNVIAVPESIPAPAIQPTGEFNQTIYRR